MIDANRRRFCSSRDKDPFRRPESDPSSREEPTPESGGSTANPFEVPPDQVPPFIAMQPPVPEVPSESPKLLHQVAGILAFAACLVTALAGVSAILFWTEPKLLEDFYVEAKHADRRIVYFEQELKRHWSTVEDALNHVSKELRGLQQWTASSRLASLLMLKDPEARRVHLSKLDSRELQQAVSDLELVMDRSQSGKLGQLLSEMSGTDLDQLRTLARGEQLSRARDDAPPAGGAVGSDDFPLDLVRQAQFPEGFSPPSRFVSTDGPSSAAQVLVVDFRQLKPAQFSLTMEMLLGVQQDSQNSAFVCLVPQDLLDPATRPAWFQQLLDTHPDLGKTSGTVSFAKGSGPWLLGVPGGLFQSHLLLQDDRLLREFLHEHHEVQRAQPPATHPIPDSNTNDSSWDLDKICLFVATGVAHGVYVGMKLYQP